MDCEEIENEKNNVQRFRAAVEAAIDTCERLDDLLEQLAEELKEVSATAEGCEELELFELDARKIAEWCLDKSPVEDQGTQLSRELDTFMTATKDFEETIEAELDDDDAA